MFVSGKPPPPFPASATSTKIMGNAIQGATRVSRIIQNAYGVRGIVRKCVSQKLKVYVS